MMTASGGVPERSACAIPARLELPEELELVKYLLIEDLADNPRWIIDWVAKELDPKGRELLSELEAQFSEIHTAAD